MSHILQFFDPTHLPEHLKPPSKLVGDVARALLRMSDAEIEEQVDLIRRHQATSIFTPLCWELEKLPANPEATFAVQKVHEAAAELVKPSIKRDSVEPFLASEPSILEKDQARERALRKLLEAKDCAVRALIFKYPGQL